MSTRKKVQPIRAIDFFGPPLILGQKTNTKKRPSENHDQFESGVNQTH